MILPDSKESTVSRHKDSLECKNVLDIWLREAVRNFYSAENRRVPVQRKINQFASSGMRLGIGISTMAGTMIVLADIAEMV